MCSETVFGTATARLASDVATEDGVDGVEETGLSSADLAHQQYLSLRYLHHR